MGVLLPLPWSIPSRAFTSQWFWLVEFVEVPHSRESLTLLSSCTVELHLLYSFPSSTMHLFLLLKTIVIAKLSGHPPTANRALQNITFSSHTTELSCSEHNSLVIRLASWLFFPLNSATKVLFILFASPEGLLLGNCMNLNTFII